MHPTLNPTCPSALPRAPQASLLRTEVHRALEPGMPLSQALGILIQALDELHMMRIDEDDLHQPARFHQAFVTILITAKALHSTAEENVLEHMTHALRIHYTRHTRVAHALVSAFAQVDISDPAGVVLELLDTVASDAAPLPFWVSNLLHLMPRSGLKREAQEALRQVRQLLQPRLDELAPTRLAKTLQRLEADPDLHGLQQLVGDLGLLALEQSPTEGLSSFVETPPDDDACVVWFSHQHPELVCVGDMPCDDHWLLTPLGHAALERVLALCGRLEAATARQLRRQMLYQYTHAARLALERPGRRHPCLILAQIHRIAHTLNTAQDAGLWTDVLEWLVPAQAIEQGRLDNKSAEQAVFDVLLLPSFDMSPLLALHTVLDAKVEPQVWLPGVARSCLTTEPGLSRLLQPLQQLMHTRPRHQHSGAREVTLRQLPGVLTRLGMDAAAVAQACEELREPGTGRAGA